MEQRENQSVRIKFFFPYGMQKKMRTAKIISLMPFGFDFHLKRLICLKMNIINHIISNSAHFYLKVNNILSNPT